MTSIRSDFSVQALGQGLLVALVGYATRSPPILIEAVAGLALIGAFGSAMLSGVQDEQDRLPRLTTFLATASGLALFGIGSAFWGLVLGLLVHQIFLAR